MLSQDAKFYLQNAKFDNLILTKIIQFFAIRCQIFRLKCTKFNFGWSSALPQTLELDLGALLLRERERERKGKGEKREGWEGEGDE